MMNCTVPVMLPSQVFVRGGEGIGLVNSLIVLGACIQLVITKLNTTDGFIELFLAEVVGGKP